jgi:DNA-binding MarR family transcriptional regulator
VPSSHDDTTPLTGLAAGRLSEQLCFALYAATNAVTRAYRPSLDKMGLTYPQYLVLLVLWEHRSCRLGEIAEHLMLATHAVSPIVDRLEDAGLVRRVKDPLDGRAVNVELTERGAALEPAAIEVQDELRCRTLLDADEVVQLRTELLGLVERLREP